MKTFYQRILEAGIEHSNHESDLYVPDTQEVRDILKDFPEKYGVLCTRFYNQITKSTWIDLSFAYDPWWEKRQCAV